MKKILLLLATLFALTQNTFANDGSYYASGNLLFPLQESAIAVRSEELTISIGDDGFATIDVLYVFYNDGHAKTIDMAFESPLPYNTGDGFSPVGKHPYISNFTTTINGKALPCRTAVVVGGDTDIKNFKTYSKKWYGDEDFNYGENYITNGKDTVEVTAYAYLFKADFKMGMNTVHHAYKYKISGGLSANFEIPYILTPCTRWANHQVDHFTLRIATPSTAKHFYLQDDVLSKTPFKVTSGMGKVRSGVIESSFEGGAAHYQEISLRNGVVECQIKNFKPEKNLSIISTDYLLMMYRNEHNNEDLSIYYNRGWMYYPVAYVDYEEFYGKAPASEDEAEALYRRIMRNLPYADRGYVFKDSRLRRFFEAQWWYMPDPSWVMSADDFTKTDWRFINELGKERKATE